MTKNSFPFKTLIWALLILSILFIFKPQVEKLIENSSEIDVLGVNIKVSSEESEKLLLVQKEFEKQSLILNQEIKEQDVAIDSLNNLAINLNDKIQGCEEAKVITKQIDSKIKNIKTLNKAIKKEPILSKSYKIIKRK